MTDTTLTQFFDHFPMLQVSEQTLDETLQMPGSPLSILFLWGRNCPNCEIAKREMLARREFFHWPEVRWMQCNVYEEPSMATRFGLHGIPTFIVFSGRRRLGRISPWPGADMFRMAIEQQIVQMVQRI